VRRNAISDYLLSVPERVLRSASALAGGLLREIGDVALPGFVRRTRLYQTLVHSTLRFLIEQVGQVEGAYPSESTLAENFLLRRTAGNGLELIGIVAFRASPVWVMAALADVSGAGRQLISEIASALKQEGLLPQDAEVSSVEQMLDGLERSAGRLAETVNTPPLDVKALRQEWSDIRREVASIPAPNLPSPNDIWKGWRQLTEEAERQQRTVWELSSLMALGAVNRLPDNLRWLGKSAALATRRTGEMFAGALLNHYGQALAEMREAGYLQYMVREFRPYLKAAAQQFSPTKESLTERLLRRRVVIVLCCSLAGGHLAAQPEAKPVVPVKRAAPRLPAISPAALKAHVSFLAADAMKGRGTASPELGIAAEYIASQFRRIGLEEPSQEGYFQTGETDSGVTNVAGVLRGRDPVLCEQYVILSAHYDHLGAHSGDGEGDGIFNGANDNASGVAGVIEAAAALKASTVRPRRSILFVAFSGEEKGLVGAKFYAANPLVPIESTVANLNLEQLGRTDDSERPRVAAAVLTGFGFSDIARILSPAMLSAGVKLEDHPTKGDAYFRASDNAALAAVGVPAHTLAVAFQFPDYHQPGDEWQKLDYDNMAKITRAMTAGVLALSNRTSPPRWLTANPKAEPFVTKATPLSKPREASAPESGSSPASPPQRQPKP
jgi:hypothetical protein